MKKVINRFIILLLLCCGHETFLAQADKEFDSLLLILKGAKEDTVKVDILNGLSKRIWRTVNSSQGMKYAEEALTLAKKLHFKRGIATSYSNVGLYYYFKGNYSEALNNYFIALKLSEEIGNKQEIHNCYRRIGVIDEEQGNYSEAMKNFFTALKIAEKIKDKYGIAACYNNIGLIYRDQADYRNALKNHFIALKMAENIGYKGLIATSYYNIGFIYSKQGNYTESLKALSTCLKIAEEIGDTRTMSIAYNIIGFVQREKGNYTEALKSQIRALKIQEQSGDAAASVSYPIIGSIYINLKKYPEAKEFLKKGLHLSKESGIKESVRDCYEQLSRLDSIETNWGSAYQHYKLFVLYRDSLTNEENTKKIFQTQLQYEFEKKEDSLKQKQLMTEVKLQTQKKQKSFYLIGVILLALLAFFVFLNFRNQQKVNRFMNVAHAKEKAELELHSLRAQLNPHFMFNSLNAIQELILKEDFDNSHTYLARFAKLLRMLVENAEKPFIPLNMELEFLELYLSLEKLRIPNLLFSITADPSIDKTKTLIPNMVLQPYIENALWHGLSQKKGEKKLELNIHKQNGVVLYDVKDNGVGRKKAAELKSNYRKEHKSKGMELLTKRFKLLSEEFGSEIKTNVSDVVANEEVGGTLVSITVPNSISESKVILK